MKEAEVKILEIDAQSLMETLRSYGAREIFHGSLDTRYYDTSMKTLTKEKKVLRLRKIGMNVQLTYKEEIPNVEAHVREEKELPISDFSLMNDILHGIGFEEIDALQKQRVSFEWKKDDLPPAHIDIDTIPGIPTFCEIETQDVYVLRLYVDALGFSMEQTKRWGWHELREFYGV